MLKKIIQYYKNIKQNFKYNKIKTNTLEEIDDLFSSLKEDVIRFERGTDLVPHTDFLRNVIKNKRRNIKNSTRFILPPIRLISNDDLQENAYLLFVNGEIVEEKYVIPTQKNIKEEIIDSINNLYENHLNKIFSNETTEKYIIEVKGKNQKMVADLCCWLSSAEIKYILINLLQNQKSILSIVYIFEKISEQLFIKKMYKDTDIEELSKAVNKCVKSFERKL